MRDCLSKAGERGHVLNLGHGVLVGTPEVRGLGLVGEVGGKQGVFSQGGADFPAFPGWAAAVIGQQAHLPSMPPSPSLLAPRLQDKVGLMFDLSKKLTYAKLREEQGVAAAV